MFHILFDTSQIQHITKNTKIPLKKPSQIQNNITNPTHHKSDTSQKLQIQNNFTNPTHHKSASSQSQQIQQKFTKTKQHHKSNKTPNRQKNINSTQNHL